MNIEEIKVNKELHLINNYFKYNDYYKTDGVVVECGTAEGHHEPSKTLDKLLNWKFIGFEVDPRFWNILLSNRPNGLNINSALSNVDGIASFNVSAWGGNSSLKHKPEHISELISYKKTFENGQYFTTISVPSITWKTFIKIYKINHVDLLILDVEGCEMMVLDGMKDSNVLPDVIQIEFAYSDPNDTLKNNNLKENFSGFYILKNKLESLGYEFNYVNYNNAYYSKKDFWNNKLKPEKWEGEDDKFEYNGYVRYDKNKCK